MTRATVCLCFDFDAVSVWVHSYGVTESPTKFSRGMYGATVATPRILDLLDEAEVETTWFVPGHTIESFPEVCGDVYDRGHDIQNHGWTHRDPGTYETAADERADVERAVDAVRELTGDGPAGYRSPSWDFSPHTLDIIRDLGFEWDSSQMGHDFHPYYLTDVTETDPDEPFDPGDETDVLEFPVSWFRDDWPPLQYVPGLEELGAGLFDERIFEAWYRQFEWMYDNIDDGVFVLTMHPQVVAQPPRLAYLTALIDRMAAKPGVTFSSVDDVATDIKREAA